MPLIKSKSKEALGENIAELISSSKEPGTRMNRMRRKFGSNKARQIAIAAAFAVKEKAGR